MFRRPQLAMVPLEAREVPALIADPVGDVLPTYVPRTPGVVSAGMDVVAHEVVLLAEQDRVVFYGRMAGSVAATQAEGALYLFGVDRGSGTPRFLSTPGPVIGPTVMWDAIVRVNPDGKYLASASGYRGKGEVKVWEASRWDTKAARKD